MLTSLLRALMPEGHKFPSRRTTARVLQAVQTTDAGIRPQKIRFCSVYALGKDGADAEGVVQCTRPTLYYKADRERPNCSDCGNPRTHSKRNNSLLVVRIASWLQVRLCH